MRTLSNGRASDTTILTTGEAYAIPSTPFRTRLIKVTIRTEQALIGFGTDNTPPVADTDNTTYQEEDETLVYTLDDATEAQGYAWIYVYGTSAGTDAYISFYG